MSIALGNGMSTLLGEDGHQLFKGSQRYAHGKVDSHFITFNQVCSEGSIVERVIPVPALTAVVIIRENPLESFDIRLSDSVLKGSLILRGMHVKLIGVVSGLVTIFAQLYDINILCNKRVILRIVHALNLLFYGL